MAASIFFNVLNDYCILSVALYRPNLFVSCDVLAALTASFHLK